MEQPFSSFIVLFPYFFFLSQCHVTFFFVFFTAVSFLCLLFFYSNLLFFFFLNLSNVLIPPVSQFLGEVWGFFPILHHTNLYILLFLSVVLLLPDTSLCPLLFSLVFLVCVYTYP